MNDLDLFTPSELAPAEQQEREQHESVVDGVIQGLQTLAAIGDQSLKVLRDKRLYRSTHATFEEYCRERFGFTRQYVNRRIGFVAMLENLETRVSKLPETEGQARPLAKLETAEEQAEAWQKAQAETGKDQPSAAEVAQAVKALEEEKRRSEEWRAQFLTEREALRETRQQLLTLKAHTPSEKVIEKIIEVVPSDYAALKAAAKDQKKDLDRFKKAQKKLIEQGVKDKLKDYQKEVDEADRKVQTSEKILANLQTQIDRYNARDHELQVHLAIINRTRTALIELAANLEGFEEVIDPERELMRWRALADMMDRGSTAIRFFIGDTRPSLTVIESS